MAKTGGNQLSGPVKQACTYIDENFATIQSLADVAEGVGQTYNNLRGKFRRETGLTLEEYLIKARLSAAEHLLVNSNLLIKEICWKVGYKDESYFGHLFRERNGTTMRLFRYKRRFSRSISGTLRKLKRYI